MDAITAAFEKLRAAAQALLARIAGQGASGQAAPARNQAAAELRVTHALRWLAALGAILAGDRHYHRPARYVPPENVAQFAVAPPRARHKPAAIARTEAQRNRARDAGRLAAIRRSFATVPTATIASRIARRLGLPPADAAWPQALSDITEPPAIWAARVHPGAVPRLTAVQEVPHVLRLARNFLKAFAQARMGIEGYQLE